MKRDCMIFSILFVLVLSLHIGVVDGTSMYPTLHNNTPLLHSNYTNSKGISRFDIVTFKDPLSSTLMVKRVVGVAGDNVYLYKGKVIGVNDTFLPNVFLSETELTEVEVYKVKDDTVYYIGDNQDNSIDSRHKGTLPVADVIGKVVLGG